MFCSRSQAKTVILILSCDWWIPTSAVHLIGCYFTVGGGALRVYISEDETSQIDVCLAHINLKLHCSLQGQGPKKNEQGRGGSVGDRRYESLVLNP